MKEKIQLVVSQVKAMQGDRDEQIHLGFQYLNLTGLLGKSKTDYAKALYYFEKAAEKGDATGLFYSGWIHTRVNKWVEQDYTKARKYFEQAAEKGHTVATRMLAKMYVRGWGVMQDYTKARKYFEQVVGDNKIPWESYKVALSDLCWMYRKGSGFTQDDAKGVDHFKQAEWDLSDSDYEKWEKWDAWALNNLGRIYFEGQGVAQNYAIARRCYEIAAKNGNPDADALYGLGWIYFNVKGVWTDYTKAIEYWQQAAEKGHARALCELGCMYRDGKGVVRDYAKAVHYFQQAAEKGSKNASGELQSLRNQLGEQHYQSLFKQIKPKQSSVREQATQSLTEPVPAPASLPATSPSDFDEKTADYRIDYQQLTLGEELGSGGFGTVFKATLKMPGLLAPLDVAVKQLTLRALSTSTQELFEQETLLWSQLSKNENAPITRLYGICTPPSPYCMVMEYMPQGALSNLLHEGGTLSTAGSDANWAIRLQFAMDMTEGLRYLHQQNIIHRDLKSMNVLISGDNRAKLADFGLSQVKKDTTSYMSKTTTAHREQQKVAGSLLWMAPELFSRRGRHTRQSDIYALGVVFWEMAARRLPFSQEDTATPYNIRAWIKEGDIDEVPEGTPKPLGEVIDRCRTTQANARPDLAFILRTLSALQQERREHAATASQASSSSAFFQRSSRNSGYQLSTASAPGSDNRSSIESSSARQTAPTESGYQL